MSHRRAQVALIFLLAVFAGGSVVGRAEDPVKPDLGGRLIAQMLEDWKVVAEPTQPLSLQQVQAKYASDRLLDEVYVAARRSDFKRAAELFDSAVESRAKVGLLNDVQLYGVHTLSGQLLMGQRKYEEARTEFERAALVAERTKGKESIEAFAARCNVAISDIHSGKNIERAGATLEDLRAGYRKIGKTDTHPYRSVLKWLAVCAVQLERRTEAIRYQKEVCDLLRTRKVPPDIELADAVQVLAQFHAHAKDWDSARNSYDEAAELYERLRGTDDSEAKAARVRALEMIQAGSGNE